MGVWLIRSFWGLNLCYPIREKEDNNCMSVIRSRYIGLYGVIYRSIGTEYIYTKLCGGYSICPAFLAVRHASYSHVCTILRSYSQ